VQQAILTALKYMHNFNPESSNNAHGYINMICYNAFLQYTQKENSHSTVKQKLYNKKDTLTSSEYDDSAINYEMLYDKE
jgi:DNA-directed RNA polymerase specialized sigma24 family protein